MCLAVPGRILNIEGADPVLRSGHVDFAGVQKRVNLSYVPEAKVGDYVLVHVGFAISTVDQAEAAQVFEYLRAMGDLEELTESERAEASEPPERSGDRGAPASDGVGGCAGAKPPA